VAVEPAVEKHISRLDIDSATKTRFDKGTGENNACIAVTVHMTRRCFATRKYFESETSRFVSELPPHCLKSIEVLRWAHAVVAIEF
jgi:hypothetical protein